MFIGLNKLYYFCNKNSSHIQLSNYSAYHINNLGKYTNNYFQEKYWRRQEYDISMTQDWDR